MVESVPAAQSTHMGPVHFQIKHRWSNSCWLSGPSLSRGGINRYFVIPTLQRLFEPPTCALCTSITDCSLTDPQTTYFSYTGKSTANVGVRLNVSTVEDAAALAAMALQCAEKVPTASSFPHRNASCRDLCPKNGTIGNFSARQCTSSVRGAHVGCTTGPLRALARHINSHQWTVQMTS